jgi:hypothetical protein
MRMLALVLAWTAVPVLMAPPGALAGGTQVAVAAVAGKVWVTTGASGVVELDARTARVERRVRTRYPFPIEIGAGGGYIWVSSVENGFVAGALTRIPSEPGRATQPLVLPARPVLALAVGSGTTWALVGPWAALRLAAVDQATGRTTSTPIRDVGWIAADATGGTPGLFGVTSKGAAVRLDTHGRPIWKAATAAIESPPAVGLGGVWAASRTTLYRLSPATGRELAAIPVASASAELALGGGRVWMVALGRVNGANRSTLLEIDPRTARVVHRTALPGPVGGLAYGDGALWLGRSAPTTGVLEIDPGTLHRHVFAADLDTARP